jgi:CheY-like chemotaxis protein
MESIGTLAGGIAHDLNNVLAPILIGVEVLKMQVGESDGGKIIDSLRVSAERGAQLVKQILSFARGIEGKRMTVNPLHLLRELKETVGSTFPKTVGFELSSRPGLWTVTGDATQLHQVFLNLCVNARDAMPRGGALTISCENITLDETYARMNPEARVGPYLLVSVTGTGTGIPKAIREHVFEPFFTTKERGKGTGLGLSTSLVIVKSHGGFINWYSEEGRGTTVKVYLPANTTAAAAEAAAIEQTGLPRGRGELVIVVDDEDNLREIVQKTLQRFGYNVMLARHGAEALAFYAQYKSQVAAVLTDMEMPVMDGPALIIALKTLNPEVKIIGTSGHASNAGVAKAIGAGVEHFIPKPYTAEALLKTLDKVLKSS